MVLRICVLTLLVCCVLCDPFGWRIDEVLRQQIKNIENSVNLDIKKNVKEMLQSKEVQKVEKIFKENEKEKQVNQESISKLSAQLQWEMQKAAFKTFVIGLLDSQYDDSQSRVEAKKLANWILNEAFRSYDELDASQREQFRQLVLKFMVEWNSLGREEQDGLKESLEYLKKLEPDRQSGLMIQIGRNMTEMQDKSVSKILKMIKTNIAEDGRTPDKKYELSEILQQQKEDMEDISIMILEQVQEDNEELRKELSEMKKELMSDLYQLERMLDLSKDMKEDIRNNSRGWDWSNFNESVQNISSKFNLGKDEEEDIRDQFALLIKRFNVTKIDGSEGLIMPQGETEVKLDSVESDQILQQQQQEQARETTYISYWYFLLLLISMTMVAIYCRRQKMLQQQQIPSQSQFSMQQDLQ